MEERQRIAFVIDTPGWAWDHKSESIKKFLSDEFEIDIIPVSTPKVSNLFHKEYDLYLAFGFALSGYLLHIDKRKKIIGVTAHRQRSIVEQLTTCYWFHANSKLLWNQLVYDWGFPQDRVFYVPNGVDETLFRPCPLVPGNVFGFVGRPVPSKNFDFVKKAVDKAGGELIEWTATSENKIPLTHMPNIYKQFNCLIVASTDDGTPNPALEAAACARTIISNKIGNMPEFIIDARTDKFNGNGILVDGLDLQSYTDSIKYFIDNRDHLNVAGIEARLTVEMKWTWKTQAENYRKMFRTILGERKCI